MKIVGLILCCFLSCLIGGFGQDSITIRVEGDVVTGDVSIWPNISSEDISFTANTSGVWCYIFGDDLEVVPNNINGDINDNISIFSNPGRYTIFLADPGNKGEPNIRYKATRTVIVVSVISTVASATRTPINSQIYVQANPNPEGESLQKLEWQRQIFNISGGRWGHWLDLENSPPDNEFPNRRTVTSGEPLILKYRSRNSSGDTWRESETIFFYKVSMTRNGIFNPDGGQRQLAARLTGNPIWSGYNPAWSEADIEFTSSLAESTEGSFGYEIAIADPNPIGYSANRGTITNTSNTDFKVKFTSPIEQTTDLKPIGGPDRDLVALRVGAFNGSGRALTDLISTDHPYTTINVRSVFKYIVTVLGDHDLAVDFVLWKYRGILSGPGSNRDDINLDLTQTAARTQPTLFQGMEVYLGTDAFDNENSCATIIGHEWVHWTNWNLSPDHFDVNGPYHWEVDNMQQTGESWSNINTIWRTNWLTDTSRPSTIPATPIQDLFWGPPAFPEYVDPD